MKHLLPLLLFSLLSSPVLACPALSQSDAYVAHNLKAYKMLSRGENGWLFRTQSDYVQNFDLTGATLAKLSDLNKALGKHGIKLVAVFIPTRAMAAYDDITPIDINAYHLSADAAWASYLTRIEEMTKTGISTVGVERQDVNDRFFYKRDHHWQAYGARLTAQNAAKTIAQLSTYKDFPKQEFKTTLIKHEIHPGTLAKAYKTLCVEDLDGEEADIYETTPIKAASHEDLFGEEPADIVLVGTSNSVNATAHANFDGFLKEYLKANVLNLAQTGGGADDALLNFLASHRPRDNPPKILIWELPVYYDLNKNGKFYQKALELLK